MSEIDPRVVLLAPEDNCVVACRTLEAGSVLMLDGFSIKLMTRIELGHKIARRDIAVGDAVLRYGAEIGSATCAIYRGEHIHLQNLKSNYLPTHLRGAVLAELDSPMTPMPAQIPSGSS